MLVYGSVTFSCIFFLVISFVDCYNVATKKTDFQVLETSQDLTKLLPTAVGFAIVGSSHPFEELHIGTVSIHIVYMI